MIRVIATVIALGALIGAIGGLVAGERWLSIGGLIVVVAVGALYAIGIWRNPLGVARAEADVEATFSGYPIYPVKPEQQVGARTQQESRAPAAPPHTGERGRSDKAGR